MKMLGGRSALVLAIVLGSLTSYLVWQYMQQAGQNAVAAPVEMAPVVVAAAPIPARTLVTAQMVRVQQVPVEAKHPNALRALGEVVGKVSRTPLTPGEQVLTTKLFLQREESGLAFMVPEGMRAVSVAYSELTGSGGMVLPGDRVDIIGVFEVKTPLPTAVIVNDKSGNFAIFQNTGERSQTTGQPTNGSKEQEKEPTTTVATLVLTDVEVLAIAQRVEGDETRESRLPLQPQQQPAGNGTNPDQQVRAQPPAQPGAKTATLALSSEDALRLIVAEDRGRIRLALRRPLDGTAVKSPTQSAELRAQAAPR